MSEQQSGVVGGETGAEMAAKSGPVAANVEIPRPAPEEIAPKPEMAPAEAPGTDTPKADLNAAPKVEAPKVELPKVDVPEVEAGSREGLRFPAKLMIMAPGERTWDHEPSASKPAAEQVAKPSGAGRVAAMAAVVVLATLAGAIGGALATAGLGHFSDSDVAAAKDTAAKDTAAKDAVAKEVLEASIARIDADITALRASVEHTAKTATSQLNRTSDRLDKVEKAQAEPLAKLAKLSDAVEKLRAAPAAAATATPARDVTGTVAPPASAAAAPPKAEVGRLPIVEGWTLRDVARGAALIEGRQGMYEVYAGDPVPGLGRVDAIRKQDGRWVVVTSKGLIVAR
nr:hypothetical protein [Bradyrhizobium lablabi]